VEPAPVCLTARAILGRLYLIYRCDYRVGYFFRVAEFKNRSANGIMITVRLAILNEEGKGSRLLLL